jgi:D-alanyl-D-alanine dipeptidase
MFMISDNGRQGGVGIKRKLCLMVAVILLLIVSGCDEDNVNPATPDLDDVQITSIEENSPSTNVTNELETDECSITGNPVIHAEMPHDTPVPISSGIPESNITESLTIVLSDGDLLKVLDYIPSIYIELKYATDGNFTGSVIYDFTDAYLRYCTVKKLAQVQEEMLEQGYSLKIWDAYRPVSAQFILWDIYLDPVYVANPNTGYSSHSRGNTVDVTLVMADGSEIEMPTGFDDFASLADRDYSDVPEPAKSNVLILENTMSSNGFNCYSGEWWHYSDSTSYSVIKS